MMSGKGGKGMEALQLALVSQVSKELAKEKPDTQLLDSYNRLLGTVSSFLIANKDKE
jgi:hypothetical protein